MSMTRQSAIEILTNSLTGVIADWIVNLNEGEGDAFSEMGYVGEDLERLMAKAAMAVMAASADIQDFMKQEGHLKKNA